jgi:hypothetical protein
MNKIVIYVTSYDLAVGLYHKSACLRLPLLGCPGAWKLASLNFKKQSQVSL